MCRFGRFDVTSGAERVTLASASRANIRRSPCPRGQPTPKECAGVGAATATAAHGRADPDGDGQVDAQDASALVEIFGRNSAICPEPPASPPPPPPPAVPDPSPPPPWWAASSSALQKHSMPADEMLPPAFVRGLPPPGNGGSTFTFDPTSQLPVKWRTRWKRMFSRSALSAVSAWELHVGTCRSRWRIVIAQSTQGYSSSPAKAFDGVQSARWPKRGFMNVMLQNS